MFDKIQTIQKDKEQKGTLIQPNSQIPSSLAQSSHGYQCSASPSRDVKCVHKYRCKNVPLWNVNMTIIHTILPLTMSFWDCSRSAHIDSLFLLNSSVTIPSYAHSVQSLSRVQLFSPWIAAHQASLSITNFRSSLKLMSIKSVMPFSHLILCHPLLLLPPSPPSIRVFSNESALRMRWPKYWSFSFSISPPMNTQD